MEYKVTDDSNLAQCEFCGYVTDRDDIPTANDPYCSDGTVTVCPECNEGESFVRYPAKAIIDRELLELAAKAAGITRKWASTNNANESIHKTIAPLENYIIWNPLTDDGDALRLAVKLGIAVRVKDGYASALYPLPTGCEFHIPTGNEPYEATRRAVVRAAAEIGKNA